MTERRPPIDVAMRPRAERIAVPRPSLPDAFVDAVRADLGAGAIAVDDLTRTEWSRDWWPLTIVWARDGDVPALPGAVVRPATAEQIATVLRRANEHRVPVTPAAGRSGVCGGAVPVAGGVVLDLTGLDAIVDIDDTSLVLSVQAGMFGDDLERELNGRGYTLGHWPQSIALSTVGGWVACRSAGQYSTRYGKIEDMVVGLDAVTPTGGALRTGGAPRAAVGPDLSQVLIGSEGTLAVVTDARLRLHPTPATEKRAAYGLASFADGLDVCRRILRRGATPACLRLYDAREAQRSYEHDANVLLVLDEGDPAIVDAMLAVARSEAESTPGAERLDDGLVDRWREHRNDVSALEKVVQAGIVVDTIEVAASWAALPGLYERVCESLLRIEGALVASAHCSHSYTDGGCLYFTFAGRAGGDPAAKDAYYRASFDAAMNATIAAGGAISHHHGIGLNRARFVRSSLGAAAFELLAGLKRHLDPNGILNPGKLGLPSPFLPEGWAWT